MTAPPAAPLPVDMQAEAAGWLADHAELVRDSQPPGAALGTLPAHSDIGASAMARLIACPGSYALSRGVTRHQGGGSSIYAATGTVAHALIEESMIQGADPAAELDQTVQVDGHDVTVDADMVEATRLCVAEYKRRGAGATRQGLEERVYLDEYWPPSKRPPISAFGTADYWAYFQDRLHLEVVDYKNGAGVYVEVSDNPQLYYYAAGVLLALWAMRLPAPVTVDITVVQPNFRGKQKVRTHHTTALDVLMWVDDVLKPTVAEVMTPGAKLASGKHCQFCPARAGCPALARLAQDAARRDFGPSPDQLREFTLEEVGQILRDLDAIEPFVKALKELAEERISKGDRVPGWTLVPSRPMRSWDVDAQVLADVLSEAGFPGPDHLLVTQPVLRSPAQLEKLLTPALWAVAETYVQSKSSGVRLVPDPADPLGNSSVRASARDEFA